MLTQTSNGKVDQNSLLLLTFLILHVQEKDHKKKCLLPSGYEVNQNERRKSKAVEIKTNVARNLFGEPLAPEDWQKIEILVLLQIVILVSILFLLVIRLIK